MPAASKNFMVSFKIFKLNPFILIFIHCYFFFLKGSEGHLYLSTNFEYDQNSSVSRNLIRLVMNALQNSINCTLQTQLKVI